MHLGSVEGHVAAEETKERGRRLHVPELGDVAELAGTVGQEGGTQDGQRGVLCAADADLAHERLPRSSNPKCVHVQRALPKYWAEAK